VKYVPSDSFFDIRISLNSISAGSLSGPRWGAYNSPPDLLVGWEGIPFITHPLDTLGVEAQCPTPKIQGVAAPRLETNRKLVYRVLI